MRVPPLLKEPDKRRGKAPTFYRRISGSAERSTQTETSPYACRFSSLRDTWAIRSRTLWTSSICLRHSGTFVDEDLPALDAGEAEDAVLIPRVVGEDRSH